MTIEFCRVCGEYVGLHSEPCALGECTSAGCHGMIVDDALALCAVHVAMVKGQRIGTDRHPRSRAHR